MNKSVSQTKEAAHWYLDQGFMPVPIFAGSKMPKGDDWQNQRYSHPDIEKVFGHSENIGIMLGDPSNGLVDVDLDCDEAIELAPLYLPPTPSVHGRGKRPGSHWWYFAPGLSTRQYKDKANRSSIVELRSTGAQTLVGPSIHPDDDIYDTLATKPATIDPDQLAAAVQSLSDAVHARRYGDDWRSKFERPIVAHRVATPSSLDESQVIDRAIAYLATMPDAISGAGGHNATFAAANILVHGFALDVPTSIRLLEEHYNPRCDPPWSYRELEHKVNSARSAGNHNNPRGHLRDTQREIQRTDYGVDLSAFLNGGSTDEHEDEFVPKDTTAEPFPMHLIDVPGFIGDVIRHNLATATRPQPILALGAAIALQAVLCARKVRDERGNRTNLYIVGIAKSSAGKEHARKINKEILFDSGNGVLEGNEDIASDAGLFSAVEANPAILFQLDEFGRFLKTIGDAKKNPHLFATLTMFMRMFSSASTQMKGKAYADNTKNKTIIQPCASIYGTTVPSHFYESLTRESMGDGFVARMFVFESEGSPPPARVNEIDIPDSIVKQASFWRDYKPCAGNVAHIYPKPTVVKADQDAVVVFDAFAQSFEIAKIQNGTEIESSIWGRASEKACRLALVRACSRDCESLSINRDDAEWACELSGYLTRHMMHAASQWVSEGQFDEVQKRVLRIIGSAGGIMTTRDLVQKTRWMKKRDRDDLIANMIDTHQIKKIINQTATKPRTEYAII